MHLQNPGKANMTVKTESNRHLKALQSNNIINENLTLLSYGFDVLSESQ